MADADNDETRTIPPVWLEPTDIHILRFLRKHGPTYHINIAEELPQDIGFISRRCKDLTRHGLLDRQSRTFYGLTEDAQQFLGGNIDVTDLGTDPEAD